MAEEAKLETKTVTKPYYVENVVRRVGSRLHRAKSATRHRFKLFIGPRRLLRNQKMPISEQEFETYKDQIKKMVIDGQVALYLPDGMRVTSLPDGRLVYRRADGALKIDEKPQPVPEGKTAPSAPQKQAAPPPKVEEVPEPEPEPEPEEVDEGKSKSYSKKSRKKD